MATQTQLRASQTPSQRLSLADALGSQPWPPEMQKDSARQRTIREDVQAVGLKDARYTDSRLSEVLTEGLSAPS